MGQLHTLLDIDYDRARLVSLLDGGADPNEVDPATGEPLLFTATRRRRLEAVGILVERGADPNRPGRNGKTPWAHAVRRGFVEVGEVLEAAGADTTLTAADRLAVALSRGDVDEARRILAGHPGCAQTGNPEEDRVLADMAGRMESDPVVLLIDAGADLTAPGLDGGTPLHQAAWFGQPSNARLLLDAGAPVDVFDFVHDASPIHWTAHGSRYSGGAESRQEAYVALARMLLEAGSRTTYPPGLDGATRSYAERLLADASPPVAEVFRAWGLGAAN